MNDPYEQKLYKLSVETSKKLTKLFDNEMDMDLFKTPAQLGNFVTSTLAMLCTQEIFRLSIHVNDKCTLEEVAVILHEKILGGLKILKEYKNEH